MLKKALLSAVALAALAMGSAQAEDLKTFRVGILGGENEADRLRNFQCLADKLPEALGVEEVQFFPASDYDGVMTTLPCPWRPYLHRCRQRRRYDYHLAVRN